MIDLDPILQPWVDHAPTWSEDQAMTLARNLSERFAMTIAPFDPPDEEWINVSSPGRYAMISTRYPFMFSIGPSLLLRDITAVPIIDTDTEELRASRDVLEATLLPHGIKDPEFNTEAFSAGDLFVESV
jgi:hypothetical protein